MKTKNQRILDSLNEEDICLLNGIASNPGHTDLWHCVNTLKYQGDVPTWETKYPHNSRIELEKHKLICSRLAGTGMSSIGTYFTTKRGRQVLALIKGV